MPGSPTRPHTDSDAPRPRRDVVEILDPADPRLDDFARLTERQLAGTDADPRFIAEGELVVRDLAASRFTVRSLLISSAHLRRVQDLVDTLPPEAAVYVAPPSIVDAVAGFPVHRGILACGLRGAPLTVAQAIADATSVVVLEDLTNHDNVGGIFRSCSALGGDRPAVLLTPRCCEPLYRKSVRVSMGQALRVPFARIAPWPDALASLAALGFSPVALTTRADATSLANVPPDSMPRPALLVGTEGRGLSDAALATGIPQLRIPMRRGVDSLNAVVATSIALQWLVRGGNQ